MTATRWAAALTAGVLATCALSAQAPAAKPAKPSNAPYLKLAEPWPDAAARLQRKTEAEGRPLFSTETPLAITIRADFKAVNKDRFENSAARYPATIAVAGSEAAIPADLGSRGHFRLKSHVCTWVPLRVMFKREQVAGTVFEGQSSLKLVTHCQDNDNFEQHVLREYLPYRIYALLSPLAFRARLAKVTYVESATGKALTTRYGMFIEDDGDVARRAGMRAVDLPHVLFKDLDQESLATMALFEYMIANTDVSILKLHNVKLFVTEQRTIYPVPYDFDFSGLVDTPYANPDARLGIGSVRNRLYRGPCWSNAEFTPVLEKFRARKADIFTLYDSLPDLNQNYRKQARSYLEEFYSAIEPARVKKTLIDSCQHAPGM